VHYQLPGGHLDKDEISEYSLALASKYAVVRELFEETGLGNNPDISHDSNEQDPLKNRLVKLPDIQTKKYVYYSLYITDKDSLDYKLISSMPSENENKNKKKHYSKRMVKA